MVHLHYKTLLETLRIDLNPFMVKLKHFHLKCCCAAKSAADVTSVSWMHRSRWTWVFMVLPPYLLSHLSLILLPPDCPQVVPIDPGRNGILVHSAIPVEPCTSLDDSPITDALRWVNKNVLWVLFEAWKWEKPKIRETGETWNSMSH